MEPVNAHSPREFGRVDAGGVLWLEPRIEYSQENLSRVSTVLRAVGRDAVAAVDLRSDEVWAVARSESALKQSLDEQSIPIERFHIVTDVNSLVVKVG